MNRWLVGIFILLFACGCDKIDREHYLLDYTAPGEGGGRCVLLEEYTGMRCVNCPAAAEQARMLRQIFKERLVVVAFHAGSFAVPMGIFQPDLRTEAGNAYYDEWGGPATPVGLVNRGKVLNPDQWGQAITNELKEEATVEIYPSVVYDAGNREYRSEVGVKCLANAPADYRLLIWLAEDSLVTPQITPAGTDKEYVQQHVFRSALNGTWGEALAFTAAGDVVRFSRSDQLPVGYVAEHCSLIFVVYRQADRKVVQVAEIVVVTPSGN